MLFTDFFTCPIPNACARPSDYLRVMQRAGEEHMAACGIPMESMLQRGETMMISRSALYFLHPELWPDTVRTRQFALHGVRAQRAFQFYHRETLVAESINEYFCVMLETRRIFRPDWFCPQGNPAAPDIALRRLTVPEDGIFCTTRAADDTCMDYNGHVNNAFYCEFALDALSLTGFPKELYLQYLHEILPNTPFSLFRTADNRTVFARIQEEAAFVAEIL